MTNISADSSIITWAMLTLTNIQYWETCLRKEYKTWWIWSDLSDPSNSVPKRIEVLVREESNIGFCRKPYLKEIISMMHTCGYCIDTYKKNRFNTIFLPIQDTDILLQDVVTMLNFMNFLCDNIYRWLFFFFFFYFGHL